MGKKRIFELARELGYQNRDLIEKLQKLGFEVKSHSSTVDADDVRKALRKAEDERRARTDERRVSRAVIRRRPLEEGGSEVIEEIEVEETAPVSTRPSPSPTVIRRRAASPPSSVQDDEAATLDIVGVSPADRRAIVSPAERSEGPIRRRVARPVALDEAETEDLERMTDERLSELSEGPVGTSAALSGGAEDGATPSAETEDLARLPAAARARDDLAPQSVQEPGDAAQKLGDEERSARDSEDSRASDSDPKKERRETRTARPDFRKREESFDEDDEKPEVEVEDIGISLSDFSMESAERPLDAKGSRVAPPPPSTVVSTQKKEEEPATKIVRTIDPNVLKARLSSSKRPEPPKEWGRPDPSEVAASPVTELVVRTDASGKRKELVDVRKEAARGKAGRSGQRRREEMSAKDLLEHRRGQVYYPTPGRKRIKARKVARKLDGPAVGTHRSLQIGETISIADLAKQMSRKSTELITWLMRNGTMATINQPIDYQVALTVAREFGFEVESTAFDEEAHLSGSAPGEEVEAELRAPVVTVMGHVDHGKTSLLDRIRSTNVAGGEAGGITQRIAGYQVTTSKGMITFLDTPGHAAFTAMRARGADITDIVILVVAADDGVMPQTVEAIAHAKGAKVPIIVAINKIDKPDANPDRVLQQLSGHGLLVEEWGGEILCRRISARTGAGVEELLELIALQAEVMELTANSDVPAAGAVIEAEIHRGRGPVATVLIQEGTLKVGDIVIAGETIGKVRAMMGDLGKRLTEAGPSTPVQILGLEGVPNPGEELRVAASLEAAKELAEHRREKRRGQEISGHAKVSLQDLFSRLSANAQKELKILIKADVQGSVEALREALSSLSTPKVRVSVIHGAVGGVVESDVEYAKASEAIIVGFGVRPDTKALKSARALGVDIRSYSVIYEAVDEVKLAMRGLLSPVSKERYLGRAEVRQTFSVPKVGTVAGCAIIDGIVSRTAQIRLLRDSKPIYSGKLSSLKRFKDDVREVREGLECGMGIEKFNDVKVGDVIEAFEIVMTEAVLDDPTVQSSGVKQPEVRL